MYYVCISAEAIINSKNIKRPRDGERNARVTAVN
jgi:hypothetical protein